MPKTNKATKWEAYIKLSMDYKESTTCCMYFYKGNIL